MITAADYLKWSLFAASPLAAAGLAFHLYNAYLRSRQRENVLARDVHYDAEYGLWSERVRTCGGLNHIDCPMPLADDEQCFAIDDYVALYEPRDPHPDCGREHESIVFDVACGMHVGTGWTILDCFDEPRFIGKGRLYVTDRRICFVGPGGYSRDVPLDDVHTVAAACSGILIGASQMDRPLLFNCVNGQRLRDTIHILLEAG